MLTYRIGQGHDRHRLEEGRRLVIGGVDIPHTKGPVAHSDGDVLLHALTDALLGATARGDIGEWFPDTAAEHADADSAELLATVVEQVRQDGWQVVNADCTIFVERPKLSPYKPAIHTRVAALLGVSEDVINIKAKTGEQLGPVGREEALEASAVVLIERLR